MAGRNEGVISGDSEVVGSARLGVVSGVEVAVGVGVASAWPVRLAQA